MKAIVKSVISGDTLVLRGSPGPQGQPPKERILHLADVTAPRMGNTTREDEASPPPWAFESRDFLRAMAIGKPISFTSAHSLPSNDDITRDLGTAEIGSLDVTSELLKNGWVKVKDLKREPTDDDTRKRDLEAEAKAAGLGLWNSHGPQLARDQARVVYHSMPQDSQAFVSEWKGKSIDGMFSKRSLVEQVRDGSTLRVRLYMPDGDHQLINIALAGVRCARTSSKPDESSEPWAEEVRSPVCRMPNARAKSVQAKFFTESRLLQRAVRVVILSLPSSTATPFQTGTSAPPPPASIFIGSGQALKENCTVFHPAGNVAEHLVAAGLARVVDWHAGMLASGGGMERLREAEKVAKEKRACLYASAPTPSVTASTKVNDGPNSNSSSFEGVVIRVWSGDQISVAEKGSGKERRLYLSSTRGPKLSDPKQAFYAQDAREFLRKKLIGKTVRVTVDFVRPREGEFEERECATVRYGGQNSYGNFHSERIVCSLWSCDSLLRNIAEQLIEKGLASVVRHRRDDEDRSPDYDKLMAAEQAYVSYTIPLNLVINSSCSALSETRGIHSGKEQPPPKQPLNLSETAARANPFLSGLKRQGKIPAIVDYVASGSRFKLFLPKDNQTLTLVLSGIRTPRTARNASEKSEPFGSEAAEFATRRYMQRDVEFEVESADKSGGFIGTLWLKNENAAISLLREGYAFVHAFSADGLSWAKQIYDAEVCNIVWKDYDEEAEKAAQAPAEDVSAPLKPEYIDVIISDVRTKNGLNFSVQVLNTEGIASLEKLMHDFSLHHKSAAVPANFTPSNGDLVSAKFSDGSWYRAKIRRASPIKKEAEVTFIDYGNQDTVKFSNLRPLDPKFRLLPGQAQDARLSFVRLVNPDSEYFPDAMDRFHSLCEGRKLIANIDQKEGNILHLRLIDPADPASAQNPLACINADLLREGLASIDRKNCRSHAFAREALQVARPRHHQPWKSVPDLAEGDVHATSLPPLMNVTLSQRLSVAFRELSPQAHLDTFVVQAHPSYESDLTACLWIEDARIEEALVSATAWPGPVSLIVVTPNAPNSTGHKNLLGYLTTKHASTNTCVHVLHVPSVAGGSSNAYLNMARFFARTSRVVLFPDGIPKFALSVYAHWLDKLPVGTPHPVLLSNATHKAFSPRLLAPVVLPRDHPVWCTERLYMFGSRILDFEDCLWKLWLESAGEASSIAVPHLLDGSKNTTALSVSPHAVRFVALLFNIRSRRITAGYHQMKIRLRWSTKYRSEACAFTLKRSQALESLSKTEKRHMQWRKKFCREPGGLNPPSPR
ncbi:hypothetical protein J3R83DRAFT_3599 [Lanmaoa asiatica]|nr:hypothetical protein J3R83DRAFT_3599 [Lanmaoa asiatica]